MTTETIIIVNQGRGPQLSTSRITVQDLLPFYREQASNEEIRHWIPSLTDDEIAVLKSYIRDNFADVSRQERAVKAYHDRERELQSHSHSIENLTLEERKVLLREKLAQRKTRDCGADDSFG